MKPALVPVNGLMEKENVIRVNTHTTHTVKFYSAIKRDEIMLFARQWMVLEMVMWSELSQSHKVKGYILGDGRESELGEVEGDKRKK
jgi:hypothetical protein